VSVQTGIRLLIVNRSGCQSELAVTNLLAFIKLAYWYVCMLKALVEKGGIIDNIKAGAGQGNTPVTDVNIRPLSNPVKVELHVKRRPYQLIPCITFYR